MRIHHDNGNRIPARFCDLDGTPDIRQVNRYLNRRRKDSTRRRQDKASRLAAANTASVTRDSANK